MIVFNDFNDFKDLKRTTVEIQWFYGFSKFEVRDSLMLMIFNVLNDLKDPTNGF